MLISGIIGYFIFKENFPSFICSKTLGIIISILFIIISFFTYSGIIGTNYAFINILLFIISIIIGEYITYKLTVNNLTCINFYSILILLTLVFLFISFTFNPPKINIFKDPIDNSYGINKRRLP